MTLLAWSLWGFLGAFVYAAPRLLVAWGESRASGGSVVPHLSEFVVALTFGPIFSAGFGEWGADYLGWEEPRALRAVSLVIGMVANPVAPVLVKLATGEIVGRLGAVFKGDTST
jgi:hypothetical protein